MSNETPRDLIWRHVRAIKTCMMVTNAGGTVRARPMTGIARPEQNAIWFYTDTDTHSDEDVRLDPRACLAYADIKDQTFVSVSGQFTRVKDKNTIRDLWNEGAAVYFPDGPDDPRVVLLRFDPEAGEYWDAPSSPIALAISFLAAKVTGSRPSLGDSGSATLRQTPPTQPPDGSAQAE
jgi:general stress protein 26